MPDVLERRLSPAVVVCALALTVVVLASGYASLGFWTMLIFTSGFLGGFFAWLRWPAAVRFHDVKWPFLLSFALFVVHRVEEYKLDFFERLAAITGVAKPAVASPAVVLLVLTSVGAWLLIPLAMRRGSAFGSYLCWTFFTALGVTELAHFIFPFFTGEPWGYFPGMASVVVLAPSAWWGMRSLIRKNRNNLPSNSGAAS